MTPPRRVLSYAEAAFSTDENGRILSWNQAAKRLLGYSAADAQGRPCHEVLRGRDVFGNPYCRDHCNAQEMSRQQLEVHPFEMDVQRASGNLFRASVRIVSLPDARRPGRCTLFHLLSPVNRAREVERIVCQLLSDAGSLVPGRVAASSIDSTPPAAPLSPREMQVLRHLAQGASTVQIAESLFISVSTVRSHVQNNLGKLDAHSKLEAVSRARRQGIL